MDKNPVNSNVWILTDLRAAELDALHLPIDLKGKEHNILTYLYVTLM